MGNRHKPDEWLQDAEARQRNVIFPDTVQNETRFWRNLGKQPKGTSTKIGLAVLAAFVFGSFAVIIVATFQAGVSWAFTLGMLLLWGPLFAILAYATRRSLRNLQNVRRTSKTRRK